MPIEITHWIQSADFSSTELGVADRTTVTRLLGEHPWQSELQKQSQLEATGDECCPPGLGVVAGEGRILHLCPEGDGTWMVHHHNRLPSRLLGFIPYTRSISETFSAVSTAHAEILIGQFFETGAVDLSVIQ